MLCLDVDGTILTHDGELRPAVRTMVRKLADAGHHVVLSTGRSIVATVPLLADLDLSGGWAVCSNGAVTAALDPTEPEGFRVEETVTFDPRPAMDLIREHAPDVLVAVEDVGVGFRVERPYPDGVLHGPQRVVSWEELVSRPTTRVTFHDPDAASEDFLELVQQVGLHGVSYAVGYTAWLDLSPEGVSKGATLEQVRRRLGVEPDRTFAAGDQRNDIEMLRWAARGVAMGNAPAEVVAAADERTGTVDEDGLADALRRYL